MSDEKTISSTTQEFLDVYDIVNDMVILKDGTVSMILQVGTMNFSLLAEQEQDAIIFTYGSLLNSLNYPIQISIQSQTKDVTKYLRLLDEQIKKASTDRKANLIKQYRGFVAALIKERNVLQKNFYVSIPASPAEMGLLTASSVIPGKTVFNVESVEKSIILEKAVNLLSPRRDHLIAQFNRLGLLTKQLNTQEIIQNFYINYNPEAAEGQEISTSENYTTPLVRASFGRKNMQTSMPNNTNQSPPEGNNMQNNANPAGDQAATVPNTNPTPAAPNAPAAEPAPVAPSTPDPVVTPAAPASIPATPEVSPEEILNGGQTNEPQAPASIPAVPNAPAAEPAPIIPNTPEPAPTAQPATNIPNISLDQNLMNNAQAETPVVPSPMDQAAQAPDPNAQSANSSVPGSDFSEEIKPMQQDVESNPEKPTGPMTPASNPATNPIPEQAEKTEEAVGDTVAPEQNNTEEQK